jgi:hypothetical protein
MTEQEWLACTDPEPMLGFLRGRMSERKFRLLAVGCCQRVCHLLHGETWRTAVEVAQRLPEGGVNVEEHDAVFSQVCDEYEKYGVDPLYEEYADYGAPSGSEQATQPEQAHAALATLCAIVHFDVDDGGSPGSVVTGKFAAYPYNSTSIAAKAAARAVAYAAARMTANPAVTWAKVRQTESAAQSALLRDIFGNPFRPVAADPFRLTPGVVGLARTIYEGRGFDRMPQLANALEEAGCDNADILAHCRQPGEHVRGCWVVDLLLGKE